MLKGGELVSSFDGMNSVFATCTRKANYCNVTSFVNLTDTPRHSIKLKEMYENWSELSLRLRKSSFHQKAYG